MKPIILITGGNPKNDNTDTQWALNRDYVDAISCAGGIPLLAVDGNSAVEYAELADGLLLSGGRDVEPSRYKKDPKTDLIIAEPKRDALEWKIIRAFLERKKPILGICRGFQMLNVYFGGTLYQDIPSELGGNHSKGVHHMISIKQGSVLGGIFGESMLVNSYHHQAIDDMAQCFTATAWSEAGDYHIVECIEHKSLPIWGVQWHPERMTGVVTNPANCVDSHPIFTYFLNQCK